MIRSQRIASEQRQSLKANLARLKREPEVGSATTKIDLGFL